MKIRDLKIGNYVVVNDLGAGKYSSGMRVIGKVVSVDPCGNSAIIESLPKHRYEITDFNDFELWSKQIEEKTEHIGQSNDLQQRKRKEENTALFKIKDLKVGYKVKVLVDNMIGEVSEIADNGKAAEIRVDDAVYRVINDNYDFTIIEWNAVPEYAEDTVNHPSHYNYGDIEVINFIEQVTQHYNANVAYHIGNAIKYLARSPHKNGKEDIDKARWYIERAFENWDK
ncbi:DUF3310 domain-containing protein [Staphylococcus saprophyticus]|uniref:DUF3310 domain-containing protein n=1 Tax=Staphylococcus saprophyticus TaxID=29385 RepID=UPI00086B9847|nr:hypothetical protein ASS90_13065 [Staphylococcus saprophyticus]